MQVFSVVHIARRWTLLRRLLLLHTDWCRYEGCWAEILVEEKGDLGLAELATLV